MVSRPVTKKEKEEIDGAYEEYLNDMESGATSTVKQDCKPTLRLPAIVCGASSFSQFSFLSGNHDGQSMQSTAVLSWVVHT